MKLAVPETDGLVVELLARVRVDDEADVRHLRVHLRQVEEDLLVVARCQRISDYPQGLLAVREALPDVCPWRMR